MLSDEEKKAIETIKDLKEIKWYEHAFDNGTEILSEEEKQDIDVILNLIEKQSKEIEELKASHIMAHNKATNTEKAKIFDVIENSIDTYIEKSKPYWEQIMTKDEMTIDEALTIIDDMYQDRYKIMSQKTEKETIVDLGKMDYIKFTNLEWASVRALREVQSLLKEIEELKTINKKLEARKYMYNAETGEVTAIPIDNNYISKDKIKAKIEIRKEEKENCKDSIEEKYLLREIYILQSLLNEEE